MFDINNLPDLNGKVALITGANSGLGIETSKALAKQGCRIIMACRNEDKAAAAASEVRTHAPNADVQFVKLDLGDLSSVSACADEILGAESKLDFLINNAGLFSGELAHTTDGFELHFGTNHLGHFALNAKLLGLVEAAGGRVIGLGSASHQMVKSYDTSDLNWEKRDYHFMQAYAQSKLANMLFIRELAKRLAAKGSSVLAVMAHPGFAATNIVNSPDAEKVGRVKQAITLLGMKLMAQSQTQGAWPTLMAATDAGAAQGNYYGPTGFREMRGKPGKASLARVAQDDDSAAALWAASEEMTGVRFPV